VAAYSGRLSLRNQGIPHGDRPRLQRAAIFRLPRRGPAPPAGGLAGPGSRPDDILVIFAPFSHALVARGHASGDPAAGVVSGPAGGRVRVCAQARGSLPKPPADVR
jgi:hypothetical protein